MNSVQKSITIAIFTKMIVAIAQTKNCLNQHGITMLFPKTSKMLCSYLINHSKKNTVKHHLKKDSGELVTKQTINS